MKINQFAVFFLLTLLILFNEILKLRLSASYNDINKQISLLDSSESKQKAMKPQRNKGFYM